MRRMAGTVCALALVFVAVGCGTNPKEAIIGKWNSDGDKDKHALEFQKDGKLIWSNDKGKAEGKYTWVDDKTIEIEYELPEEVYQLQKEAFDKFKSLGGGIPGVGDVAGQMEPIKKVKDRASVEIKDGMLTLTGGNKTAKYKKG